MQRVADWIIQKLHNEGIDHIFLLTGRGILFLTDAVAGEEGIDSICTYHEQGASYAAMAYALARGGMAACLVSTGCAATNAVTAALCAFQDSLPVVFISGQHTLRETSRFTGIPIRTYGSQEADIVSIVKPITKYATMLSDALETAVELEKAVYLAQEGRPGPVWLDIPLDIQNSRIDSNTLRHFSVPIKAERDLREDVEAVYRMIRDSRRPLLLVGGGIRSSGAETEVGRLSAEFHLPVVFTPSGADVYGASHELSLGAVGSIGGSRAGNFALQNADFILAVGTRLCSQLTGNDVATFAREAKLVVVDIDPIEHTKTGASIFRLVIADAKQFLRMLLREQLPNPESSWIEKCIHWKKLFSVQNEEFVLEGKKADRIELYTFADFLGSLLPDDATVITDAGFEELIIPAAMQFKSGQRCLFPAAQGSMGYAVPAIIGAYFAGRRNITAVIGDGSLMMNVQELQLIHYHKIPVKIFVINNNMYAVIRKRQKDFFRRRTIGNDPSDGVPAPDFSKIADCFGIPYKKIEKFSELQEKLPSFMASDETFLCEVICTPEQKYLHQAPGMNEKRKLVRRSLEDLSPFISRDTLRREMIIAPLE